MNVIFYPNLQEMDNVTGKIDKLFKFLRSKRPDLWRMVLTIIEKVNKYSNLDILERQEIVGKLRNKPHIYEFRIPPTKSGGVIRLYFGYKKNDKNTIVILTGEFKKKREANSNIIKLAEKYYKEVCL